jgi:lysophospholipase L1-like esterase
MPEHAIHLLPCIIPKVVPKNVSKIVLIAIFFGANDASLEGTAKHVPLERYASNLRELLSSPLLKQHNPSIKLLLITPPPICAHRKAECEGQSPSRTAEHTALYAAKAKSVADELGVPYVDLWSGFLHAVGWKEGDPLIGSLATFRNPKLGMLLPDGLHFSAEGNKLCYKLVFERIKEVWPDMDPEGMETNVPMWDMQKDILGILKEFKESRIH